MIKEKIKKILASDNKNQQLFSDKLGILKQSLSRKMKEENFTTEDLIKLADLCSAELCFITKDGEKISLTLDDISKD